MTLSALFKKIEKVENEINKHQEIISDKKKDLAELKKQQRTLQLQEKQKRGERFISTLEAKLGTEVTDEMLNNFLAIAKESSAISQENNSNNIQQDETEGSSENIRQDQTEGNPENIQQDETEDNPENIYQDETGNVYGNIQQTY